MDEQSKQHGAFSWCELMTTDVESAKIFYSALFGWEMQVLAMPGMPYTLVKVGDKGIGGIMSMPEQSGGMEPNWGAYVTVDDVDAVARRAPELGGKVLVPPQDIPNVGRFCVLQDPQGAFIRAITYVPM